MVSSRSVLAVVALIAFSLVSSRGGAPTRARPIPVEPAPWWATSLPSTLPLAGAVQMGPAGQPTPSLRARFPWDNPEALGGFGSWQLWASPEIDEIRVHVLVDAPAERPRWETCEAIELDIDGARFTAPAARRAHALGDASVFEVVDFELGVHVLRALAGARRASGSICGDPLSLRADQLGTLRRFVRHFDRLAMPPPRPPPSYRPVGPDDVLPGEEDEPGPLHG